MKAMYRLILIFSVIMAFSSNMFSQVNRLGNTWLLPQNQQQASGYGNNGNSSPVVRRDTIVVEEYIKRTDVIHRTEEVINPNTLQNSTPNPQPPTYNVQSPNYNVQPPAYNVQPPAIGIPDIYGKIITTKPKVDIMEVVGEEVMDQESQGVGNYIWVPDSMESQVMDLLRGKTVLAKSGKNNGEQPDMNEMVTFRGKKIPMILKDRNLGRYDRGLFNYLFIPKGIWQMALTASYGEFSTEDLQILDLVSDIDFNGHIFSIKPAFSYFVANNSSIGLRFGYTSGKAALGRLNVDLGDDMNFDLMDIMYRSKDYSAAFTYTHYLGITRRGRFGIFNEVELAVAGGSSDFNRPYEGKLRRTHTNVLQGSLNFSPGLCVYILEPLSFNISFGVFGLNIKHEKQTVDDEPAGERTTSGANFRFNIFNINFGIAVNI